MKNALYLQSGGPTAVINSSLYGVNVWNEKNAHETPGSVWGQIGIEIWPPPPPCMVLFSKFANLLVIDEKASFLLLSWKIFVQTGY